MTPGENIFLNNFKKQIEPNKIHDQSLKQNIVSWKSKDMLT